MNKKQQSYEEIARLADCLKSAARMSDDTCQKLFGVTKDEAIKNILKGIEREAAK